MDIREVMLKKIGDLRLEITERKMYDFKSMPEKKRKNLLRIDPYFNYDDFVAVIDTTLSKNATKGIVFTVNGVYLAELFSPSYFVNYADVESLLPVTGYLGSFSIKTIFGDSIDYRTTYLGKATGCNALSELLAQLTALALENNYGYSDRATGKVERKLKLTQDEKVKANLIIHPSSAACGSVGAGLAQLPGSDWMIIMPIQVGMIIGLGASFGISVTEGAAKGILTSAAMSFAGRGASQLLVGWIPGVGNAINATTATALTQAIGWIAVRHFKIVQAGGYFEGMKAGVVQAARQFEKKYRTQANEFLKKEEIYSGEITKWTQLIADYVQLIAEYELESEKSQETIEELKTELEKLQALPIKGA